MIDKKLFCEMLESIQIQMLLDREVGAYFIKSSGMDLSGTVSYDNSRIIKACVKLLQQYFPKDEHGHCEISHYCFDLEFGKPIKEGLETETFEQLYKRLLNKL